ncbi:MAG: hypothetical protein IJJ21_02070 [Firmicutes bacterium]|nr:hypothetical protein [Bacillota bacterium]
MADFYIRTFDLTKILLALEKEHQDVVCLSITEEDDDPENGCPASLWISSVNSSDPDFVSEDSIDSDESLADLF